MRTLSGHWNMLKSWA